MIVIGNTNNMVTDDIVDVNPIRYYAKSGSLYIRWIMINDKIKYRFNLWRYCDCDGAFSNKMLIEVNGYRKDNGIK